MPILFTVVILVSRELTAHPAPSRIHNSVITNTSNSVQSLGRVTKIHSDKTQLSTSSCVESMGGLVASHESVYPGSHISTYQCMGRPSSQVHPESCLKSTPSTHSSGAWTNSIITPSTPAITNVVFDNHVPAGYYGQQALPRTGYAPSHDYDTSMLRKRGTCDSIGPSDHDACTESSNNNNRFCAVNNNACFHIAISRFSGNNVTTNTRVDNNRPIPLMNDSSRRTHVYLAVGHFNGHSPVVSDSQAVSTDWTADQQMNESNQQNTDRSSIPTVCNRFQRTKRYFVGGFKPSMSEAKLYRYVERRGVSVTTIRIFRQKRYRGIVIRLNVEANNNASLVEDPYFWPRGVTCRPWVSQYRYETQKHVGREGGNGSSWSGETYSRQGQEYPHYVDMYNPYLYPDAPDVD